MEMENTKVEKEAHGQYDDDAAEKVCKDLKDGRSDWSEWRTDARECYDYYASRQWDSEDAKILEEQQRPCVTFNRLCRTINAVAGLELQNRQEVRYLPRQNDDGGFSDMLTSAAKWARDLCDAEDEESEMFQDCLITGIGWTETRIDTESSDEPQIKVDRIDPLEMLADPESKKRNFDDARWVARVKHLTKDEFEELFPDAVDTMPSQFWNDDDASLASDDDEDKYRHDESAQTIKNKKTIAVAQYQCWKRQVVYMVPEGNKVIPIDEEKFQLLKPMLDANRVEYVKTKKKRYHQYFIAGKTILDEQDLGYDGFTFRATTGLRDRNKNKWFGLVALMKDPQRWANKYLSQIQHIINTSAKSGAVVEEGVIINQRNFEENFSKPGSVDVLRDGAISQNRFMQKNPPAYPEGVDRLLQYAIQAINDVPGVSLEFIGMTGREQAMGLEDMRRQAGVTVLASFFDALRRYRKEQGRVLAFFIREYIADGRLIRVLGEEGAKYVPLIKDQVAFDYDIIVDDAPTSPNMKEKTFRIMSQILPLVLQAGIPIPPEILEYAPLPDGLIQKWKAMLSKSQDDPIADQMKQIQMLLAQLEVEQKQADIQKTSSEITFNYAKSEQAHAIGQDESAQAMEKMGANHAELQMKAEAMQKEQARKDLEMMLNMKRKELEAQLNARIKTQQVSYSREENKAY